MVAYFVYVHIPQQFSRAFLGQRIHPIFNLRVAREEKFPSARLKHEDNARVVHRVIKNSDNLE
jgi:hypothetical protein